DLQVLYNKKQPTSSAPSKNNKKQHLPYLSQPLRSDNNNNSETLTEGEKYLYEKLSKKFQPTKLHVQDISGGCGSMYAIEISSLQFNGLPIIKQHRMINELLEDDIKKMHGIRDGQIVAFNDKYPAANHHILVIPKRHIKNINGFTKEDVEMGFGSPPFNSVLHVHMHVLSKPVTCSWPRSMAFGNWIFRNVDEVIAKLSN
ncbi:2119_t:CDS:2, partial [Dentiscutata heterogama]